MKSLVIVVALLVLSIAVAGCCDCQSNERQSSTTSQSIPSAVSASGGWITPTNPTTVVSGGIRFTTNIADPSWYVNGIGGVIDQSGRFQAERSGSAVVTVSNGKEAITTTVTVTGSKTFSSYSSSSYSSNCYCNYRHCESDYNYYSHREYDSDNTASTDWRGAVQKGNDIFL